MAQAILVCHFAERCAHNDHPCNSLHGPRRPPGRPREPGSPDHTFELAGDVTPEPRIFSSPSFRDPSCGVMPTAAMRTLLAEPVAQFGPMYALASPSTSARPSADGYHHTSDGSRVGLMLATATCAPVIVVHWHGIDRLTVRRQPCASRTEC